MDGVFIAVGIAPESELYAGQLELDEQGYIRADESGQTSVPGVFAAGDVRTKGAASDSDSGIGRCKLRGICRAISSGITHF
ncbi:MAG: FAD-dependent oxidoreductase [Clostridium fessum]